MLSTLDTPKLQHANWPDTTSMSSQVWKVHAELCKVQPGVEGAAARTLQGAASQVFEVQLVEMFRKGPVALAAAAPGLGAYWTRSSD